MNDTGFADRLVAQEDNFILVLSDGTGVVSRQLSLHFFKFIIIKNILHLILIVLLVRKANF